MNRKQREFFFFVYSIESGPQYVFNCSNKCPYHFCVVLSACGTDKKIYLNPVKGLLATHSIREKKDRFLFSPICFFSLWVFFFSFIWGANNKSKWIAALKIYSTEKYIRFHYIPCVWFSAFIWKFVLISSLYSFRLFKYFEFIYSTYIPSVTHCVYGGYDVCVEERNS